MKEFDFTGVSPLIDKQCSCGSVEVTPSDKEQIFLYGAGVDPVELKIEAVVWTCSACGFQWTDGDAEEARDAMVRAYLGQDGESVELTPEEAARFDAAIAQADSERPPTRGSLVWLRELAERMKSRPQHEVLGELFLVEKLEVIDVIYVLRRAYDLGLNEARELAESWGSK